jgi:hypothetical protein
MAGAEVTGCMAESPCLASVSMSLPHVWHVRSEQRLLQELSGASHAYNLQVREREREREREMFSLLLSVILFAVKWRKQRHAA